MIPRIYYQTALKETSSNEPSWCEAVKWSTNKMIDTCKNEPGQFWGHLKGSDFWEKLQWPVIKNGVIEFNGRIFKLPSWGASVSLAKDGSGLLRCMDKDWNYLPTPTEIKNNESGSSISSVASLGSYDWAVALINQANSRMNSGDATKRADGVITHISTRTSPISSPSTSSAEGQANSIKYNDPIFRLNELRKDTHPNSMAAIVKCISSVQGELNKSNPLLQDLINAINIWISVPLTFPIQVPKNCKVPALEKSCWTTITFAVLKEKVLPKLG